MKLSTGIPGTSLLRRDETKAQAEDAKAKALERIVQLRRRACSDKGSPGKC
jgi:hypothetical protein